MRSIISLLLILLMAYSLVACSGEPILTESGEAMRGKSEEEKERIAKEYIQKIQSSTSSEMSG